MVPTRPGRPPSCLPPKALHPQDPDCSQLQRTAVTDHRQGISHPHSSTKRLMAHARHVENDQGGGGRREGTGDGLGDMSVIRRRRPSSSPSGTTRIPDHGRTWPGTLSYGPGIMASTLPLSPQATTVTYRCRRRSAIVVPPTTPERAGQELQRRDPEQPPPTFEPHLFRTCFTLLRWADHLTDGHQKHLDRLFDAHPRLRTAWEALQELYQLLRSRRPRRRRPGPRTVSPTSTRQARPPGIPPSRGHHHRMERRNLGLPPQQTSNQRTNRRDQQPPPWS